MQDSKLIKYVDRAAIRQKIFYCIIKSQTSLWENIPGEVVKYAAKWLLQRLFLKVEFETAIDAFV